MKTLIAFLVMALSLVTASAQTTTVDISTLDTDNTTTFQSDLVVDVATAASTIAAPEVSISNPFAGQTLTIAQISFDVYNYGDIKVLGALLSFFDNTLGRLYFSNGSYLGANIAGLGYVDANMLDFALENDFIGSNVWKNVKLQFSATGFSVLIDDVAVFNESSTKADDNVTVAGDITNYSGVLSFLSSASTVAIGTGSWWSDNTSDDGLIYWDAQNSYIKNITFTNAITTSISTTDPITEKALRIEYYSVKGIKMTEDYNALEPGLYIQKSTFPEGRFVSQSIVKLRR